MIALVPDDIIYLRKFDELGGVHLGRPRLPGPEGREVVKYLAKGLHSCERGVYTLDGTLLLLVVWYVGLVVEVECVTGSKEQGIRQGLLERSRVFCACWEVEKWEHLFSAVSRLNRKVTRGEATSSVYPLFRFFRSCELCGSMDQIVVMAYSSEILLSLQAVEPSSQRSALSSLNDS